MDLSKEPGCRMSVLPVGRYFAQKNKPMAVSHDFVVGFSEVGPALHLGRGGLGRTLWFSWTGFWLNSLTSERAAAHMAGQLRFDLFVAT